MKYRIILFASLIVLVVLFWVTLPSKKVEVIFCDVGQGDAALMIYKNWQMMIDVGPNNKKVLKCLENNLPFWDKKIEVVVITHKDNDHIGGLTDLSKFFKIEQIFYPENLRQSDVIKNNWMMFEVVNPKPSVTKEINDKEDRNESSVAGIWRFGGTKILMTADIDIETEQRLVWQNILKEEVDILKVSHHGSKNGTTNELLEIIKPKIAVISVGKGNRYGHPNKEVLERLKGIEIKRTDLDGEVHVVDVKDVKE